MVAMTDILAAMDSRGPRLQFSSTGMEVLSSVLHLFGVSLLSYMLALKLSATEIFSFHIVNFSWTRLLVILNILDAWAFLFTAAILVHGTGMELSLTVCTMGILNCIIFYTTSKIVIYLFLVEKVHVVWAGRKARWRSKVYIGGMTVIAVYVGIVVFLIIGRIAYFRDDGACVIGLIRPASLTLLIYDLFINVLLTVLFVWPLLDRQFTTALKGVAIRTLWAAGVALTTSCVNILVLTIMHGKQLAWVCLASCGTDVIINAAILCWVTSGQHEQEHHSHEPSSHNERDKPYTSNIVFCGENPFARTRTGAAGDGDFSRPPGVRGGRISNMFDTAKAAPTDIELSSVSADLDSKTAFAGEEDSERSAEDRVGGLSSLVRAPLRAHTSTMKRVNNGLMRHTGSVTDELQIIVTRETNVRTDDTPPQPKKLLPSPPDSVSSE